MEPVTLSTSAAGALLKPVIAEVVHYLKGKVNEPKRLVAKALSNTELGRAAYNVISVKTLWNVEKEVSLFEFYYPSRLLFPDSSSPRIVDSFQAFPSQRNYVIQGTAGQGKSILLRYLYGQQILNVNKDRRVPVFVELRRVADDKPLKQLIGDDLLRLGLPFRLELLPHYFASGKIVLLLDGFDEVHPERIQGLVGEVEDLAKSYPELCILATARPDSAIQKSSHFRVVRLDPLNSADHKPFLEKICKDKAQALSIMNAIRTNSHDLATVLSTPLLLTLLVLLYRAQSTIPSTLARFYEQLFDVLFFRHDQTKPGFQRARHTNLDESQLKRTFEAFSFQSQITNKLVFTENEFSDCVAEASSLTGVQVSPPGFKKELIKTACLMVEDGPETSFIHKSVAEFYAATFVQRSNAEFAKEFYSQITEQRLHSAWAGELAFLKDIDSYRFARHFLIPELKQVLSLITGADLLDSQHKDDKWLSAWLSEATFALIKEPQLGEFDLLAFTAPSAYSYRGYYSTQLFSIAAYPIVSLALAKENRTVVDALWRKHLKNDQSTISVGELDRALKGRLRDKLKKAHIDFVDSLNGDLRSQEKIVEREEAKLKLVSHLAKKLVGRRT